MTCAACHTRQIEVAGTAYRIDGGPALVDFESFLSDLDVAVDAVLTDGGAFADFARAVVGAPSTPPQTGRAASGGRRLVRALSHAESTGRR